MSLEIKENSIVYRDEEEFVITKIIDFNYVFAQNTITYEKVRLSINELSSKAISKKEKIICEDLSQIPRKKIEDAKKRFEAIKPILGLKSRKAIEKRAEELHISPTTLYNWLRAYESSGQLTSLVFFKIKGGKGKSRLTKEQEEIINIVLKEYYLTKLKPTATRVYEMIVLKCKTAKIKIPGVATVRRRINSLSEKLILEKRNGKKATEKFEINKSEYPDGLYPLHVLQIDHTRADIILVDDKYREELGRPWITMAIDVYSRMVTGFYISFETPGYFATGQTLYNSIIPKNKLKIKFDFKSEYPVWGIPNMIHMDNAKEFRGIDLQNVCNEYGINIVWRPVGKARFGGHIERLLGTLSKYIHTLEGTTFSNIQQRGEYNSQKNANMTLNEFEKWLTILITDVYHNQIHSQLGISPLQKYEQGIFGTDTQPPRGLPKKIENEHSLFINLLPKEERTIQQYGIQIDTIYYYSEVLNTWIDSYDVVRSKKIKKKFIIRRDPRDISQIWFFNPKVKQYYLIPYRNSRLPKVSIWEFRAAQNYLKKQEDRRYNEDEIFEALEKLRRIAEDSKEKTKIHRKQLKRIENVNHAKFPELIQYTKEITHNILESNINKARFNPNELVAFDGIDDNVDIQKEKITTNHVNQSDETEF
jgi:putative transposase